MRPALAVSISMSIKYFHSSRGGLTRQSTGSARKAAQAGDFGRYPKGNGEAR